MTNIVKYENAGLTIEARLDGGKAWITYEQAACLFGCSRANVTMHASAITEDRELPESTCKDFLQVRTEGNRSVSRSVSYIDQDMVLHIGYRVRSERGVEFRRWASSVIKGEADPIQRVPTPAEQLLANAQLLVEQERRLALTEQKVAAIEATFAEREAHVAELSELPAPAVPAPPKTCGQLVVEAVRGWGHANNKGFQEGFRKLYREVEYRCGIDLKARKRNKPKLRMMDIIDGCGKPREVYAVACEIFHVGRAA